MNCKIKRFDIGENMRIITYYENMQDELQFFGDYKTKINNVVNWYKFSEKVLKINEINDKINFKDILVEMRNEMIRKVELYETLVKSFENIDEIIVEEEKSDN